MDRVAVDDIFILVKGGHKTPFDEFWTKNRTPRGCSKS